MASFQPFGGATKFFAAITFAAGLIVAAGQGITINDGAPSVTTNKLYQVGGALFWNGSAVAGGGGGTGLQMNNSMTTGQIVFGMNTSTGATLVGFTLVTSTSALYLPTDYTLYATNTVLTNGTSTGVFASQTATATRMNVFSLNVSGTLDTKAGVVTCGNANCLKTVTLSAAGCNPPASGGAATSSLDYYGPHVYRVSYFQPLTFNACELDWLPPDSWDGSTVVAKFIYAVTTTDNNGITWGIQGQGMGSGALLSTAFSGSTSTVTSVATTTNGLMTTTGTTLTVGGLTAQPDVVKLRLTRSNVGASTNTASLVGVSVEYGSTGLTD